MQQKLLLIQIQIEIFANAADILCTSHPIVNFHLKISIINQNINFPYLCSSILTICFIQFEFYFVDVIS